MGRRPNDPLELLITKEFIDGLLAKNPLPADKIACAPRLKANVVIQDYDHTKTGCPDLRLFYKDCGRHATNKSIRDNRKQHFTRKLMQHGLVIVEDEDFFRDAQKIWKEQGFKSQKEYLDSIANLFREDNFLLDTARAIFQDRNNKKSEGLRVQLVLEDAVKALTDLYFDIRDNNKTLTEREETAFIKDLLTEEDKKAARQKIVNNKKKQLASFAHFLSERFRIVSDLCCPQWNIAGEFGNWAWASVLATLRGAIMQDIHIDHSKQGLSSLFPFERDQTFIAFLWGYQVVSLITKLYDGYYDQIMDLYPEEKSQNPGHFWRRVCYAFVRSEDPTLSPGVVKPFRVTIKEGQTVIFSYLAPHCGDAFLKDKLTRDLDFTLRCHVYHTNGEDDFEDRRDHVYNSSIDLGHEDSEGRAVLDFIDGIRPLAATTTTTAPAVGGGRKKSSRETTTPSQPFRRSKRFCPDAT